MTRPPHSRTYLAPAATHFFTHAVSSLSALVCLFPHLLSLMTPSKVCVCAHARLLRKAAATRTADIRRIILPSPCQMNCRSFTCSLTALREGSGPALFLWLDCRLTKNRKQPPERRRSLS